jgi:putative addiction module component (TIGR02574 family)
VSLLDTPLTRLASHASFSPDSVMTPKTLRDEILRLPPSDRLALLEEIWDSVAASPEDVPVPDWHKVELDRRLEHPAPGPGESWDDVRARLAERKRK